MNICGLRPALIKVRQKLRSLLKIPLLTHLYCHDLVCIPQVKAEGCSFRYLDEDTLHWLLEMVPLNEPQLRTRLSRGDKCYAAFLDSQIVHYSWVQSSGLHWVQPAGRHVSVAPGEFWIFHCRTAEAAKGRGIYPTVLTLILREFREAGYKRGWIYTSEENFASQRGILRAGFMPHTTWMAAWIAGRAVPLGSRRADPASLAALRTEGKLTRSRGSGRG